MISDIFQYDDWMRVLILTENLFEPWRTSREYRLMGFDTIASADFMNPQSDITQDFTGEKLVKRLGQLLRIVDPS